MATTVKKFWASKPGEEMTRGAHVFWIALIVVLVIATFVVQYNTRNNMPIAEASEVGISGKPVEVYRLIDVNVPSYAEINKAEVILTGVDHDGFTLVNPRIVGDRVYIPEHQKVGQATRLYPQFFFRDQLELVKGRIYRPVANALTRHEEELTEKAIADAVGAESPCQLPELLIDPEVGHGGDRIYLPESCSSDGKRHFIYRPDAVLLNPEQAQ